MAKIGLKHPVIAVGDYSGVNATTPPTYSNGMVLGKAIAADKEVKFTTTNLYADDSVAESDVSFDSGTLKLGIDDLPETAQSVMFNHTLVAGAETSDPQTVRKGATDNPPYLGTGYYKTGKKNNVPYYEATWLYKVKFTPPKESCKTKEGGISWQTPETEGTIYQLDGYGNNVYEDTIRFATEADAIAWLDTKAGISTESSEQQDGGGEETTPETP